MTDLLKKITGKEMNRRDFLKASAAGAAGLALAGTGGELAQVANAAEADAVVNGEGEWIPAACGHNCGGRCSNKALVVNGVVIRQKTDDMHEDSPEYPQQRGCLRGRSTRKKVFGADRLKYPMKRKHWEPGGGDKSLRGRDEWVRISWEEAFDILASETKRITETYGSRSILSCGHPNNSLRKLGGATIFWGTASQGTWVLAPHMMGYMPYKYSLAVPGAGAGAGMYTARDVINDRFDIRNCETIVMVGMNPVWSSGGSPTYHWLQAKKAGAKFIMVDPYYNDTAVSMDAEWIPVRPSADMALLLGVAHTLISEDDPVTNPLIDWDFLNRCTIGFDAEHMPEGADPKENFKDYVLGTYDNIPKNAEWASERCGTEPDRIRYLARELRKDKKVAFVCGWASARTNNADNLPQLFVTIGAMTGHIGKSGHMTGSSCHVYGANGGLPLVNSGGTGLPTIPNLVDDCFNAADMWPSILKGKYNFTGNYQFLPGEERDINIQMIYHGARNTLQTTENINSGIEVHRKVEFVVAQNYVPTMSALYADLVLPVTTEWETIGGFTFSFFTNREMVLTHRNVTPPLYEAKTDREIDIGMGERLGFTEEELYPFGPKQQYFNQLATCNVIQDDGKTFGPLVTITKEDIDEWGVNGTPQEGKITLKEFLEKGVYQVKRTPNDNLGYIAFENFRKDPEANPLPSSESGKIEIYSKAYAECVNAMGYTKINKPYPTYIAPVDGYENSFRNWETKEKGDYPYQVFNPHYLRRSHTIFDNVPWVREAFTNPLYINATDAKKKDIKNGDTVIIENKYGKTLRNAVVTERIMPGVVSLPHGTWAAIDEDTGIDRAGADNMVCGPHVQGMGTNAYNSNLVNIEKYLGEPLVPDAEQPQRIIF